MAELNYVFFILFLHFNIKPQKILKQTKFGKNCGLLYKVEGDEMRP
jgi:hypothetical protein